jgi:hypothetical protein
MTPTQVALTIDIDWAPDFVIDYVADILVRQRVKATWFVTHASQAVDRLRDFPALFELGIHPNLLPGSSHGDTPAAVLEYCMRRVPEARSMRTHALVQSTPFIRQVMTETPIERDVSLFLPYHQGLQPVEYRLGGGILWRVPYFWEDDFEMEQAEPCWDPARLIQPAAPLAVFDFHPIHVFLNSATMAPYREMKMHADGLANLGPAQVAPYVSPGEGTQTAFRRLVDTLHAGRVAAATVAEIHLQPGRPS